MHKMTTQIRLRRDIAANWTDVNPVLALGEPGIETDTRKIKYGDGSTEWNLLEYSASEVGPEGPAGQDGAPGADGIGVPAGGAAGQVLSKINNTDYNTEWVDQTSGATNEITNTDGVDTYSVSVGTDGVVTMNTSRGGLEFGALPEPGGPTHFHIMRPAGQEGSSDLYFGDDYNYVKLPGLYGIDPNSQQAVEIGSSLNEGPVSVWQFGTDGNLTLPTNSSAINYSNGQSILEGLGGGSSYDNSNVANYLPNYTGNYAGNIASLTGNVTAGYFIGNGSQLTGVSYANISNTPPMVSPSYELHVAKNGNDTTGNGDVLNPYLTIGKALTMASSSSYKIIVHAGEYTEDVTINNIDFLTITSVDSGGISAFKPAIFGNLTVSGTSTSTAIKNVGINNIITHSASGSLYLTDLSLGQSTNIGTLNKTGSGYLSIQNCNLGISSGVTLTNVNITGSGTVVFNNTQLAAVTVNNASASVSIVNNSNTLSVTLTAGTLNVFDSYMYTLGNSGFYAVNATGGALQIRNSILVNPNQTPARVNLASPTVFAYDDIYFDRGNSILGVSANATVDFQSVRLSGALSVTGNVSANYFLGNGSQLTGITVSTANTVIWTTAPTANTDPGTAGQAAYDTGGNLYVCVTTNTWSKFSGTTSW